jgi:hypothetical protein
MKHALTIALAAEQDLSLDEQRSRLDAALREQFGNDDSGYQRFYIYEVFNDYLIARGPEGALYRISYALNGDDVTLGDAQEVTTAYVPVAESCEFIAGEAEGAAEDGRFPIVALKVGWGRGALNGQPTPHFYPAPFVAKVAEALKDAPFGRRHPDQKGSDPVGANDATRIAGWLDPGKFDGQRATTFVNLFDAETDLRSRLGSARKAGKLGLFGVSQLAAIGFIPGVVEGKQCLVAEELHKLYSVDLCAVAGAGGEFLVANAAAVNDLAARQSAAINPNSTAIAPRARDGNAGRQGRTEGAKLMKESLRRLLEALRTKNAARAAELTMEFATVTEAEYPALMTKVTDAMTAADATQTATAAEAAAASLAEAHRIQSKNRIEQKLTDSKLPEPAKKLARGHLEGMLVSEAELADAKIDAEIASVRTAFAALEEVAQIRPRVVAGLDTIDKKALAMECAFGVKASMGKGIPGFRGLREAYIACTGDYDLAKLRSGGGFTGHVLASEAVVTGDFPNLLLNSMTKRLLQDYAELAIDGLEMLYQAVPIGDFLLQDRVRDGYFPELSTVAEAGPYTELAYPTDERVSYQVAKRGNLLTITEETIRNDNLGAIARFPGRLARAGRQTLRSFITNFFVNNTTYMADSVSWFNAGHSNLGAVALSQDALTTARTALRRQTEKDSGEYLGLNMYWLMVPPELETTAKQINQTNTAGSNAFYHAFGDNDERIIVNEKLTDTNDWYYGAKQEDAPFLEIGFLDGIQQPQIFLANQPTIGTQFTNDELQYKVKFVFGGAIIDYRGVGKNVVAG